MRVRPNASNPSDSVLELYAVPREQDLTIDDFTQLLRALFGHPSVLQYFESTTTPLHTGLCVWDLLCCAASTD
jgi:hypothetical protein